MWRRWVTGNKESISHCLIARAHVYIQGDAHVNRILTNYILLHVVGRMWGECIIYSNKLIINNIIRVMTSFVESLCSY